jgi:hypothetical protein
MFTDGVNHVYMVQAFRLQKVCEMRDTPRNSAEAPTGSAVVEQPSVDPVTPPSGSTTATRYIGRAPSSPWWRTDDLEDRDDDEGDQLADNDPATWALTLDVDQPRIDSDFDVYWESRL